MAQPEIYTEQQIHQAIINNEMFLEYMPTVSLAENLRCVGAEALVRWKHDGHVVEPMAFVPVVENTPVAGALTYWVIDQVAKELGPWLKRNPCTQIGINVPPRGPGPWRVRVCGAHIIAAGLPWLHPAGGHRAGHP